MRLLLTAANLCTDPYPVYPLGMSVIAKALADAGHTVRQFDALADGLNTLPETIRSFRPDAIGVSIRNLDTVNSRSPEKDLLKTPLRLIALTQYHKNWLEANYPDRFAFEEARDGFDYLYDIDRLADLPGKKLHAKRNHIHRLDEAYPGWDWTPMTQADIAPCLAMDAAWHQEALTREAAEGGLSTLDDEHRALVLALENREALGLDGIVLRWQEEILGFTLGALLTENVFDVHFERARGDIQGAYPAVNRSFARYIREKYPQVRYLDREDDMGLPGLRKAKESYYPDYLEVNFSAVEIRCDLTSRPKTEG